MDPKRRGATVKEGLGRRGGGKREIENQSFYSNIYKSTITKYYFVSRNKPSRFQKQYI